MSGGRNDQENYVKIINHLKQHGEVLTEHVGQKNVFELEKNNSSEFIWQRDMQWLKQADVVIAEVTQPSLGVGYELGIAEKLEKKTLCLYCPRQEKRLSKMVSGNKNFEVVNYAKLEEALKLIDEFICG